jgi:hypothetical protein
MLIDGGSSFDTGLCRGLGILAEPETGRSGGTWMGGMVAEMGVG